MVLVAVLGLVAVGTSSSFATTGSDPIYMKYGTIQGDVTATGHENWIELNSFQFGVSRAISPVGTGTTREASVPSISDITITKVMDKSSPSLLTEALQGTGQTVTIDLVKNGQSGPFTYAEYELSNALISGYSVSSGGDNPSESISISFTKITFKFTPQNPDGTTGIPSQLTWDLAQARLS